MLKRSLTASKDFATVGHVETLRAELRADLEQQGNDIRADLRMYWAYVQGLSGEAEQGWTQTNANFTAAHEELAALRESLRLQREGIGLNAALEVEDRLNLWNAIAALERRTWRGRLRRVHGWVVREWTRVVVRIITVFIERRGEV